ncbi:hypothetical protein KC318_g1727 [Hortaea werneckii]|uniref:Uncharacterized protein n=1 Tax=Hortaea werneckii TaxID=91943 RepID=A0A3M6ZF38_HORWE|nr:hypothetical protein KC334_g6533 [Hortaea werneckii]KAI7015351.1 hypothetical protein KC355_g4350 [Hortaea werneckii]KAI7674213.1 hypothetical protein KC318_g1727 [Hortaea werneckii]RMY13894.1 hypothetical protein D0867_07309 [Hortaea werneckii]
MDVSAFEVDSIETVTFAELLSTIPLPIRRPITATLSVGIHIAKIFILLAALAGCAAAYCLALAWIYTLRVQSRLLVLNAALLKTAFHQGGPVQDVRVRPPAAQTVRPDGRPNRNGRQDQTQLNLNKATAAPSTRGTRSSQERISGETDSARTGDVTHNIVGLSLDKDPLSLRRQVGHETALNTATVDGSVSSGAHQAPDPLPQEPRSRASLPDGQHTQPTGAVDSHAQTTWLEEINAAPPSAVFEAGPPLKAADLRNVDAGPSLQGSAEALSVCSSLTQYHFALLTMTRVARAFLNDATKAGNKNRGREHVKSQSVTSHVPNASAARNDRKTAQSFVSVRSNPSRANGPRGLPQARASPIRPSSANLLLPGQLPPHILAAKEARERRSRVHQAEDVDKLTAKTVLPPPPALASQNRYAALSQGTLTPESTTTSVSSFTPTKESTKESSMENEQKSSDYSGLRRDSHEELLLEVPSKTSAARRPRKDSHIFSIETLKSFDTPLATCISQHDEQSIKPGNNTASAFDQDMLPHPPSTKTKSSLVPTAPPFFASRDAQSNVTSIGSTSDANQHMQQTHRQNAVHTGSTSYGHSALLNDLHGWNHVVDAHDGDLDPPQPGQAYNYSILHPRESDLSDYHAVLDAGASPSVEHHLPSADLQTPFGALLTSLSSSEAIPILTPAVSEPDPRLELKPLSDDSANLASASLEKNATVDGFAYPSQGTTDGQESPATKSSSSSMALSFESRENHPESGTWSAHNRGIQIEPAVDRLTMQDRTVNGFQQENDECLISFQSSEEIARSTNTPSGLHCVDGKSTGSVATVASGHPQLDTFDDAPEPEPELSGDQCETTSASHEPSKNKSSNKIAQKERRQVRKVLRDELLTAWCARESARKRVAGSFSLDRMKALQDATRVYHAKREGLQKASPEGDLNKDDALMFPKMPVNDVSTPQRWPPGADEAFRAQQEQAGQSERKDEIPDPAAAPLNEDLSLLKEQALKALQNFRNAEASVKYPAPQGRAKMKQLKEDARAKLKRARQWYVRKRKEVEDKNPDDPSLVDKLPWVAEHM